MKATEKFKDAFGLSHHAVDEKLFVEQMESPTYAVSIYLSLTYTHTLSKPQLFAPPPTHTHTDFRSLLSHTHIVEDSVICHPQLFAPLSYSPPPSKLLKT